MAIRYDVFKKEALTLPEVEESTSYGTPALKVRNTLMTRLKEDQTTVVVRSSWENREKLLVIHPEAFFVTDHYRNHPWVLLRLETASLAMLRPVLEHAWRLSAPKSLLRDRVLR
jgi:hypothetical protein